MRTCAILGENKAAKAAVAGFAAAVLVATPANAGVVLQKPALKNALVDDTPALSAEEKKAAKAAAKAAAPAATPEAPAPAAAKAAPEKKEKKDEYIEPSTFNILPLILPGAVVALVGGGFALTKIDPEFAEVLEGGASRDCNQYAGFEVALKSDGFSAAKGTKVLAAPKKKGFFS